MSHLSLENVRKEYPGVVAVADASFEVDKGECISVLGPSGSGKTTVLRMIAGFEAPLSGRIRMAARTLVDDRVFVPPEERGVGMVFQEGALFPHLTVGRNIGFGLRSWPADKRDARISELLELVGLPGLERRYPHELSGGQQQRVALARGLAPSPAVLLLDEPFSSVDERFRELLRRDLRSILRNTGTTTILVTHDTEDALSVSDRVVVMNDGRVLQVGTPEEVYNRPRTPRVAEFFGRMNILRARAVSGGIETAFGVIRFDGAAPSDGPFTVGLRPENLALREESGPLQGIVEDVIFAGNRREIWLRSPSTEASGERIVAFAMGRCRPAPGALVRFDVPQEGLVVFG